MVQMSIVTLTKTDELCNEWKNDFQSMMIFVVFGTISSDRKVEININSIAITFFNLDSLYVELEFINPPLI